MQTVTFAEGGEKTTQGRGEVEKTGCSWLVWRCPKGERKRPGRSKSREAAGANAS